MPLLRKTRCSVSTRLVSLCASSALHRDLARVEERVQIRRLVAALRRRSWPSPAPLLRIPPKLSASFPAPCMTMAS